MLCPGAQGVYGRLEVGAAAGRPVSQPDKSEAERGLCGRAGGGGDAPRFTGSAAHDMPDTDADGPTPGPSVRRAGS